MSEDDQEDWKQARPFIVGLVALAFTLSDRGTEMRSFDQAEAFVAMFEKRNGIAH